MDVKPQPLITPQLILIQAICLFLFILYSFMFGPPKPQHPKLGSKPITIHTEVEKPLEQQDIQKIR